MPTRPIIIAGAGPVGLVSALRLAEAGIHCIVIERDRQVSTDLRASTFHPPTLDMLAPYGIAEKLIADGLVCPTWQIRMQATGEKALFDLGVIAEHTDHPYRLQCEQSRLCEHIVSELRGHPSVDFEFEAAVTGVEQDDDGVRVTLTGPTQRETRLEGAFLIGADGAGSAVRRALGLAFDGKTYPETTLLVSTTFPFHRHIDDLSNVSYCWSPKGNFALLRLKSFWRCSLYYEPGQPEAEALADDNLQMRLNEIVQSDSPFEIIDRRPYQVHQRIIDTYQAGRVFLAGDAAHVNSPSGGMGMNGGVHDAFSLTARLIAAVRTGDSNGLDSYTAERRPVAEEQILKQADENRKRMAEKDPEKRLLALRALQAIAADPKRAEAFLLRSAMITGLRQAERSAASPRLGEATS